MSDVLILTGMHRSATSLVASLFQRAGVQIGARLLEANSQNPRGFFEDVEFYNFHENVLHARGKPILVDRSWEYAPSAEEDAQADALIAARAQSALWGWKDPRTSLVLGFWRDKLPHAHFLLVYRHPFDVLLSLMRRNQWYMAGLLEGLEAWYAYNCALAEFRAQYPQQALLCNCYAIVDHIQAFDACLQDRFGLRLNLDTAARDAQYQPDELRRAELSREAELILQAVHPEAGALYARLNELADMPAAPPLPPASSPELDALANFARTLKQPDTGARRGLLFALLGVTEPQALEAYVASQTREFERLWREKNENAAQRDAWQKTAEERLQVLREQQAWATARMTDLEKLEAHPVVRALKKMGGA